jgi:tRNA nucleotidyltransferase (CCA-adding enzyme)
VSDPIPLNAAPDELERRLERLPGIDRVRAAAAGEDVYLVGGAVRDLLLGRERADLDLVVEGDVRSLAAALGDTVRGHLRFGTATIRVGDLTVDVASARAESYPAPGALPEVRPATIADDLGRRDFTINAMALPLHAEPRLLDPHAGLEDLGERLLRVLHPGSFADDPTRALRAARYAARLGLQLEPVTAEAIGGADLGTVSADRVTAELRRIASEDDPARALALSREWGLIAQRADAVLAAASGDLSSARSLTAISSPEPSRAVEAAHGHAGTDLALARAMGAEWLDPYVAEWRGMRLEIGGSDLLEAGVSEGPEIGRGLRAALRAKLDGELPGGREAELRAALEAAREG